MSGNVEPLATEPKKVYVMIRPGICAWISERLAIELGLLPDPASAQTKPASAKNKMRKVRNG